MVSHPFPPLYDHASSCLILGSFPSVKSRDQCFFYSHPQNRFWRVTAAVFQDDVPNTIDEKKAFLYRQHIALWDVIASCDITGSADSTIQNVVPNDLRPILANSAVQRIFVNGRTAEKYYNLYIRDVLCQDAVCLPSTSPANAAWGLSRLIEAWRIIAQ